MKKAAIIGLGFYGKLTNQSFEKQGKLPANVYTLQGNETDKIGQVLQNHDTVIVTADFGEEKQESVFAFLAKEAKENNTTLLVLGTTPFSFEGKTRALCAEKNVENLQKEAFFVGAVNQNEFSKYLKAQNKQQTATQAFSKIDTVLYEVIQEVLQTENLSSERLEGLFAEKSGAIQLPA